MTSRHTAICAVLLFAFGCASEEQVSQQWDDYVDAHNSCTVAADCAVIYPGCPLGCWAAVSGSDVADAQAEAQKLIARYERGGRSCAYDCVSIGEVMCEAGRCAVGESSNADPGDPCADKVCGDSCTTCMGNNCPAVEEYCDADGVCTSDQPMCSVAAGCEDSGGTCTAVGDCAPTQGHIGDPSCDGVGFVCCLGLDSCAGEEPACTDGSSCGRPFCVDGAYGCGPGFSEDTQNTCGA